MGGGENWVGGEVVASGERSRDEERRIGAKVIGVENTLKDDKLAEEKGEDAEQLHRLNEAVFDKIDMMAVVERTMKVAEKIDLGKLAMLRDRLQENLEIGAIEAEDYFAEILGLSLRPRLDISKTLEGRKLGGCVNGGKNADRISIDMEKHQGDADGFLGTLAHENWHSYQNDIMRKARTAKEGGGISEEMRELAELYEYNDKAYIRSDVDYEGYRKQLCEVEAETFATLVRMKIGMVKAEEQKKIDFMAQRPEVYGEENLAGIEREVDEVLHGLNMGEFLQKAGVGSLDELWRANEDERVTQGYAMALSDLVGLEKPMTVEFVDELGDDKKGSWDYKTGEVTISRKRMWDFQPLSRLPEVAWKMRQREMVRNNPASERGGLYRTNLGFYIQDSSKMHGIHKRQLLVRESDYFREELLHILDEQATLEEIGMMSPEEQVEARKEQEEVGWTPMVSEKYGVKGK